LTPAGPLLVLLGASLLVAGGGGWGTGLLLVQPTAASSSASSNVLHGGRADARIQGPSRSLEQESLSVSELTM
jgi:hypothetical protein